MIELLVEKYRPKNMQEFLGSDENKKKFQQFIDEKNIPHMLLHGSPGIGKDSIAKILIRELDADYLYINASDENNVDTVRHKIKNFSTSVSFSNIKIIVLTEADYLTANAQAILRNIMEEYSTHTRFILTCNYIHKIIDPIISRTAVFEIDPPKKMDVAKRVSDILTNEGVQHLLKDVASVINLFYPDIRRILNETQRYIKTYNDKKVFEFEENIVTEINIEKKLTSLLFNSDKPKNKFLLIRKFIADNKIKQFNTIYSYFDKHITDTLDEIKLLKFITFLQEAQYQDGFVLDKEINFMSFIAKVIQEKVI